MKNILLVFSFLGFIANLSAQPINFYNNTSSLTGLPLRSALKNIIDGHNSQTYAALWTHFQTTDKKTNNKVWDIYSDVPGGIPPYEFTFGTDQCGNYSVEGDCYNREHTWPQSWFNSALPMNSDLYHLYPTDGKVNGYRGNYPYGEVNVASITSLNGSKVGSNVFPGYSGTVFEPIDEYKGDLARTYFYMSTRYYGEDGAWQTTDATTKSDIKPWQAELLMKWHLEDPVSDKERKRNNKIYAIQNNRNPFIDHPQLVCKIWSSTNYCDEAPLASNINAYNSSGNIVFSSMIDDNGQVADAKVFWGLSQTGIDSILPMTQGAVTYFGYLPSLPVGTNIFYKIFARDNLGFESYTETFLYNVQTGGQALPPNINSVNRNPLSPFDIDSVQIIASITDDIAVSSARCYWGTDSTNANNIINMTLQGSNYVSNSKIPATSQRIFYRIEANDNQSLTTYSGFRNYLPINTPPQINAVILNPSQPRDVDTVVISANVSDMVAVNSVYLEWGLDSNNFSNFNFMNLNGSLYVSDTKILPYQANTKVFYRIIASDNLNLTKTGTTQFYETQSTIGLVENANQKINIYPNPFSNTISFNNPENLKINSVFIYNLQGKVVWQSNQSLNSSIDLSSLSKGFYFIQIQTESGIYNQKVLKN